MTPEDIQKKKEEFIKTLCQFAPQELENDATWDIETPEEVWQWIESLIKEVEEKAEEKITNKWEEGYHAGSMQLRNKINETIKEFLNQ